MIVDENILSFVFVYTKLLFDFVGSYHLMITMNTFWVELGSVYIVSHETDKSAAYIGYHRATFPT